jgi:arginine/ornithine transport system substrate-binding protein
MRQADRLTAMRNILAAFAVAVLLPVLPARADKLTFGNEGTYPPFSVIDPSGRLTGFEPELAREMCKRMDAECDIVAMDFKALIPSL